MIYHCTRFRKPTGDLAALLPFLLPPYSLPRSLLSSTLRRRCRTRSEPGAWPGGVSELWLLAGRAGVEAIRGPLLPPPPPFLPETEPRISYNPAEQSQRTTNNVDKTLRSGCLVECKNNQRKKCHAVYIVAMLFGANPILRRLDLVVSRIMLPLLGGAGSSRRGTLGLFRSERE